MCDEMNCQQIGFLFVYISLNKFNTMVIRIFCIFANSTNLYESDV